MVQSRDQADDTILLARDGRALTYALSGFYIEAQFALPDDHTLLCIGDESVWDATLRWYLVDGNDAVTDAVQGGGAFSTGLFKLHNVHSSSVDFEFFTNDSVYRVSVLPDPRFRFVLAPGWFYTRRLHRHRLKIEIIAEDLPVSQFQQSMDQSSRRVYRSS